MDHVREVFEKHSNSRLMDIVDYRASLKDLIKSKAIADAANDKLTDATPIYRQGFERGVEIALEIIEAKLSI